MVKTKLVGRRELFLRAGVGLAATVLAAGVLRFGSSAASAADNPPTVSDVKGTYAVDLMRLKGVFGVGVGQKGKEEALVIFVRDAAAKTYIGKLIRDTIEGHPVVILVAQQPGSLRSSGSPSDADSSAGSQRKTRRTPAVSENSLAGNGHRDPRAADEGGAKEQR
jgi:hypothetical protein